MSTFTTPAAVAFSKLRDEIYALYDCARKDRRPVIRNVAGPGFWVVADRDAPLTPTAYWYPDYPDGRVQRLFHEDLGYPVTEISRTARFDTSSLGVMSVLEACGSVLFQCDA